MLIEMKVSDDRCNFKSSISTALSEAENELATIEETINSIEKLKPSCDKLDYILAACSGALSGIIDI